METRFCTRARSHPLSTHRQATHWSIECGKHNLSTVLWWVAPQLCSFRCLSLVYLHHCWSAAVVAVLSLLLHDDQLAGRLQAFTFHRPVSRAIPVPHYYSRRGFYSFFFLETPLRLFISGLKKIHFAAFFINTSKLNIQMCSTTQQFKFVFKFCFLLYV